MPPATAGVSWRVDLAGAPLTFGAIGVAPGNPWVSGAMP
jgi:hypothetical protein